MGQSQRQRPSRLAKKLLHIRKSFNLSQDGMVDHLGFRKTLSRERISAYEQGEREPSLPVLLQYAKLAGVWVDALIDDDLDLPEKLPASPKSEGVPRNVLSRSPARRGSPRGD